MSSLSNDEASSPAHPPDPPPPPPLPPQRYGNRAANAIARFAQPFIYGSRPPSAEGNRPHDSRSSGLRTGLPSLGPARSTTHKTGIPIAALDISPCEHHAVLAGRDILKTVRITDSSFVEDINLRSKILTYAATGNTAGAAISAKHKDQLAANDVKWSNGKYSTSIATAAANGQIVIYDINRADLESARLHEHNRQVHRLAFNPHQGAYLLSGSQDATVRLWDLRAFADGRSVSTCRSDSRYSLNNEGIRDLRWSPKDGMEFAAGTDNGVIQRWDFRKTSSPLLKINAHDKTCHAIDWHPDGKHLASGGTDKNVKVWDFSSTDRRMKVCWQIRTPQAIREVRWRPFRSTSEGLSHGSMQCTQLATSYHLDPRIHLWDLRRPSMPFREIDRFDTLTTAILWYKRDLLLSVDLGGNFTQTDINHTSRVLDQRSPNVVAIAPEGTLNLFSDKRPHRRSLIDDVPNNILPSRHETGNGAERLSGSQNVTDSSFEEPSLLSSSFKSKQQRAPSSRSSKSIASTPPSTNEGEPILKLDEALQKEHIYRPTQCAVIGNVFGVFDGEAFKFLARQYTFPPVKPGAGSDWDLHGILAKVFERNATLAAYVGQHRLAQSWRILAVALEKELKTRAEQNRSIRFHNVENANPPNRGLPKDVNGNMNIKPSISEANRVSTEKCVPNRLVAPVVIENGSNVTTPLARPVSALSTSLERQRSTAILDEDETFRLPVPAFAKQSPRNHLPVASDLAKTKRSIETKESESIDDRLLSSSARKRTQQVQSQTPPATGFMELDPHMAERRAAMSSYRAQPKPLLRLDDPFYVKQEHLAPTFGRHDSNESFQMFSASTDSSHHNSSVGSSFGSSQESEKSGSMPKHPRFGVRDGSGEYSASHADLDSTHEGVWSQDVLQDALPIREDPLALAFQDSRSPFFPTIVRPTKPQPPIIHVSDFELSRERDVMALENPETRFIPSDFDFQDNSLPSKPWSASAMIPPLINYHTNTLSDTQMPAFLILYLAPYMPMSIPPSLELSILISYHEQLTSLSLYCQAAHLRKLVEKKHPEVTEKGTHGIAPGGPWCTVCKKPSKGDRDGSCKRCDNRWAPCPICNGEGPMRPLHAAELAQTNPGENNMLWAWCQDCGHGGHAGCLRVWWNDPVVSEGGCATIGCLHDCVSGSRRDELFRRAAEDRKIGLVKGDEWVVGESKAVEKARDLISANNTRGGRRGHIGARGRNEGSGSSSAGLGGRSGSGSGSIGKKVRLVVPNDTQGGDVEVLQTETSASAP